MIKDIDSKFEELAKSLLFTGGPKDSNDVQTLIEKLGLQYRKGKSFIDVKHAATKALKNGNYRTEHELSMFSLYLKHTLKTKKALGSPVALAC